MKVVKSACVLAIGFLTPIAALAATSPCPALNNSASPTYLSAGGGCNEVITIATDGTASIAAANPNPYEGSEDQYIGIINNSPNALGSITLSGPAGLFDFENDGIDAYGIPGNALDTSNVPAGTGYGGPNAYFTGINGSLSSGTVNFITAIAANGGTGYFSLELSPSQGSFQVIGTGTGNNPAVPEPGSIVLLGTGLAGLLSRIRRTATA